MLNVLRLCALVSFCLTFAACDTQSVPATDTTPISYIRLAPSAPPNMPEEIPPEPANPRTEIWRPGYWSYSGGGFSWVPGEMMPRPSPTAVWAPDMWLQHDYGWAFVAGYWQ